LAHFSDIFHKFSLKIRFIQDKLCAKIEMTVDGYYGKIHQLSQNKKREILKPRSDFDSCPFPIKMERWEFLYQATAIQAAGCGFVREWHTAFL
jgi:hypothetical protein